MGSLRKCKQLQITFQESQQTSLFSCQIAGVCDVLNSALRERVQRESYC